MIEIQIKESGGPEVLVPIEASIPEPGEEQVLIEVEASGVNRPDVMQRKGLYPPPPGASSIPGLEVSGTVRKLGKGANPDLLGKSVCALVSGGGHGGDCRFHQHTHGYYPWRSQYTCVCDRVCLRPWRPVRPPAVAAPSRRVFRWCCQKRFSSAWRWRQTRTAARSATWPRS
jgi:hypothetical protein